MVKLTSVAQEWTQEGERYGWRLTLTDESGQADTHEDYYEHHDGPLTPDMVEIVRDQQKYQVLEVLRGLWWPTTEGA